ncbi:MAG: hypothetical protein HY866_03430 [Chloroflexi bacterium]|nr:hypothetical protein [Chloroflexota bacterium]
MRKAWIILVTAAIVVVVLGVNLTAWGQGDESVFEAALVSKDETHLTIYENGFTLVRDVRTFQLEAGLNRVRFSGVPEQIEQGSVSFVSDQPGSYVLEQRFVPAGAPFFLDTFLQENVGQPITVVMDDEESTTYTGTLLSVDFKLVIQLESGAIVTPDRTLIREFTLADAQQKPVEPSALSLLVRSEQAGPQQLTVFYLFGGLSWQNASYNLRLGADNTTVDFTGWVSLYNSVSVPFENATTTLGVGDFDRLQYVSHDVQFAAMPTATMLPTATPTPAGGNVGGMMQPANLLIDLPYPVTLPANSGLLVEFLAGAEAAAQNVFVYDSSPRVFGYSGFITNPDYGLTDNHVVQNYLGFSTKEEGGLGMALPAGLIRIYQENESGASLLIGQTQLAFTREGEDVRIFLENSTDLIGTRTRTDIQVLSADAIQETFEIRLTNSGDRALTVTVPERMTRSARWEILGATMPYEQPDQFGVVFTVDVPAGGESVVTYTVLYTTP